MKKYRIKATIDKTFNTIHDAHWTYCRIRSGMTGKRVAVCDKCPLSYTENGEKQVCDSFVKAHPDKAAELMGLEIEEVEQ